MKKKVSIDQGIILTLILMLTMPAFAAHPQLLMDTSQLNFIRAKVTANTSDWQTLKASCDTLAKEPVRWPAAIGESYSSSTRINPSDASHPGWVSGGPTTGAYISTSYYGSGFNAAIKRLGVCYQALKPSDPNTAATYLAQAHNIITAIAQPLLTMSRQSDGAVRYGLSADGYLNDLKAGAPLSVYLYPTTAKVADVWTISGAQGCTSMNGTWRVSSINGHSLNFTNLDGSAAPMLNADCTLYSVLPNAGSTYGMRYMVPALALAYDWFYDGLSDQEKSNLVTTMNEWVSEIKTDGYAQAHPESNYYAAYLWGIVADYVATDGDNPTMSSWFTNEIAAKFAAPHMLRDYQNLWLGGGGNGEGWQGYGYESTRFMMNAALAMKLHGTDWTQSPYNWTFVDDTLRYWMQFTTPSKLELDDNEFVYPTGATEAGITAPVWIPLSDAALYSSAARRFGSAHAFQFQDWYNDVYAKERAAAGTSIPGWSKGAYTSQPRRMTTFFTMIPTQVRALGPRFR